MINSVIIAISTCPLLVILQMLFRDTSKYSISIKEFDPAERLKRGWILNIIGMGIVPIFLYIGEPFNYVHTSSNDLFISRLAIVLLYRGLHPWALYCIAGIFFGLFLNLRHVTVWQRTLLYVIIAAATVGGMSQAILLFDSELDFIFHYQNTFLNYFIRGIMCIGVFIVAFFVKPSLVFYRYGEINAKLIKSFFVTLTWLILIFDNTLFAPVLSTTLKGIYTYLLNILPLGVKIHKAEPKGGLIWIAWVPFMGMYTAKMSEGRSLRQLIIGSLLLPSAVSVLCIAILSTLAYKLNIIVDNPAAYLPAILNKLIPTNNLIEKIVLNLLNIDILIMAFLSVLGVVVVHRQLLNDYIF